MQESGIEPEERLGAAIGGHDSHKSHGIQHKEVGAVVQR